jgi:glutamate racemase
MHNNNSLPIGVFDSGMGGLTVLRALKQRLPAESFIYLGDTARLPYGTKSSDTVLQYAIQMARLLVERQIKALVIACNTATTAALPHLQALLPDIPVIGVVRPGASAAAAATKNRHIAVFATETTITSKAYQTLITEQLQEVVISARPCSVLVALAEEGMTDNAIAREALFHYLSEFKDEDTLLLGCTHFPVFKPLLVKLLPAGVSVVDSAEATAAALHTRLQQASLLNQSKAASHTHYLVTDSITRFQHVGEIFLGAPLCSAHIELVDA